MLERRGRQLRVFDGDGLEEVLQAFVQAFRSRRIFPGMKRLVVKEYPPEAQRALQKAGFLKEMQDYVLYL